jgi:hypothetical protein
MKRNPPLLEHFPQTPKALPWADEFEAVPISGVSRVKGCREDAVVGWKPQDMLNLLKMFFFQNFTSAGASLTACSLA